MHTFGHKGKKSDGIPSRTRSKAKQKESEYCDCPESPAGGNSPQFVEKRPDKAEKESGKNKDLQKMAVKEQLKELQDLFNKRYDQLGSALTNVQAALKEPTDNLPVKAKLEPFSGYENQDVKQWLLKFKNRLALRYKKHDSKAAAADLSFHLSGAAETWYYSLDPSIRDDFNKVEEAFLEHFANSDLEWRLQQKLSSRKQEENENLDSYVDFISNTCQWLGVSDTDKMHFFVQGLREDIKRDMLMQKPKTFHEAESVARLKVSVERTLQDDRSSSQNADPKKAVLYKMLEGLMINSKEPREDTSPKVAAFIPQKELDFTSELKKLRTELTREFRDELRAVKDTILYNREFLGGRFPPK